jgi:hypothetical protein
MIRHCEEFMTCLILQITILLYKVTNYRAFARNDESNFLLKLLPFVIEIDLTCCNSYMIDRIKEILNQNAKANKQKRIPFFSIYRNG